MRDHAGASWSAVDPGERHGPRLCPWLGLQAKVDGILSDGAS